MEHAFLDKPLGKQRFLAGPVQQPELHSQGASVDKPYYFIFFFHFEKLYPLLPRSLAMKPKATSPDTTTERQRQLLLFKANWLCDTGFLCTARLIAQSPCPGLQVPGPQCVPTCQTHQDVLDLNSL